MLGLDRIEVKKVFISQPMRRKSEAEIKAVREEIVKFLGKKFGTQGFTVIDSYHPEWAEELKAGSDKRVFFLGKSIQMLADADYAFFADGWSEFDGCLIEHDVCRLYKIPNNIYRIREDSARNSAEIDGESAASETPCGGASAEDRADGGETARNGIFTDTVKIILQGARDAAVRLGNDYVGTEHLLFSILKHGGNSAAEILQNLDIELSALIDLVVRDILSVGQSGTEQRLPFTPRLKRVLENAARQAREVSDRHISTQYLLLALLKDSESPAAQLLIRMGVDYVSVLNEIRRIREDSARNSAEIDGESAASETPCGGASAANTASDGSTRSEEPIYKILRSYNINHELELFKLAVDITNSTTDYLTDYLCGDKPWEDRNKLEANIMAAYSLLRETWERIKQERGI